MGRREGKFGMRNYVGSSQNLGERAAWGASADAQSYWQGRFAACTFVGSFLGIGRTRNSWGVAPNPSRDAVPAPCKGQLPLDPSARLSWSRFHAPSACSFLVLRLSPCLLPSRFREEPKNARLAVGRSRAKGWLYELAGCNRRFNGAFRRTLKPFGSAPLQSSPARALCHRREGRF